MIAVAGRARIEEQKQTSLINIQAKKVVALKELNIQYAKHDQAKTSFGYIGITFLSVLFGSIFLNDFVKLCIYYFENFGECGCMNSSRNDNQENVKEERDEIVLEMDKIYAEELEESLEKVYFKLVKANAKKKKTF
jgi:uncharacterized membrane protein